MRYFLLPDTHLGHHKMLEIGRPADYEARILTTLIRTVKSGDVLIHLGDVALGWSFEKVENFFKIPGHKILVRGNHDKHWSNTKWLKIFDAVVDGIVIKDVLFTHVATYTDYLNIHAHSHLGLEHGWYLPDACLLSLEEMNYNVINLEKVLAWRLKRWREIL